ncbi:MAG: hypothetical protein ABW321_28665 [Polyangiales bacterium]
MTRLGLGVCLLLWAAGARAEVAHSEVDPTAANPEAPKIHGPHLTSRDPAAQARHQLVVFLPGTNGLATDAAPLLDVLAHDGYHAVSLDYTNTVLAASLRPSKDRAAFDNYRRSIVFGGQATEQLTVAPASSIASRISDLLQHLAKLRAAEGWSEFYDTKGNQGVVWQKLLLIGHSQGAGHAAFLAQQRRVAKVLLIAGPQDFSTVYQQPAPWLSAPSRTPRERFHALLHRDDAYDVKVQIAANQALLGSTAAPVYFSDGLKEQATAPGIVVSERPLDPNEGGSADKDDKGKHAHVTLARVGYAAVWRYLLSH